MNSGGPCGVRHVTRVGWDTSVMRYGQEKMRETRARMGASREGDSEVCAPHSERCQRDPKRMAGVRTLPEEQWRGEGGGERGGDWEGWEKKGAKG